MFPFLKGAFASWTQKRPNCLHPFLFADLLRIIHYRTAFNYMSGTSGKSTCFPEENKVLEHQCSASTLRVYPKVHLSLFRHCHLHFMCYLSRLLYFTHSSPNAVRNAALPSMIPGTLCSICISVYATPITFWLIFKSLLKWNPELVSLSYFALIYNP